MLRIEQTPEQVADTIRKFELLDDEIVVARQIRGKDLSRLSDRPGHVVPEDLLVGESFGDGPRVDLPANRLVKAELFRKLRGPCGRRRDLEPGRKRARIEVDRRQIELHFRLGRDEMKSA